MSLCTTSPENNQSDATLVVLDVLGSLDVAVDAFDSFRVLLDFLDSLRVAFIVLDSLWSSEVPLWQHSLGACR